MDYLYLSLTLIFIFVKYKVYTVFYSWMLLREVTPTGVMMDPQARATTRTVPRQGPS